MPKTKKQNFPLNNLQLFGNETPTALSALGDIVQLDHAIVRLAEMNGKGKVKAIGKEKFMGQINNGIQPSFTSGFYNARVSDMAVGSWDASSWRFGRHIKSGKMVIEDAEYTDGRLPGKRVLYLDTIMTIRKRMLSEKNGYRITPSDESGMYSSSETADAVSSELNAHNLLKDRMFFSKLAVYARENIMELDKTGDIANTKNTGWGDKVVKKIVEIEANLMDGFNVQRTEDQTDHHPSLAAGEVLVVGDYATIKPLVSLYMTFKNIGSNSQVADFKTGTSFVVNNITFTAIPAVNMTDNEKGLAFIGKADGSVIPETDETYKKLVLFITTTGKTAVVGAKFQSRVYSNELNNQYGDLVVQSKFLHAITGNEYTDQDEINMGELYKDHTYAIVETPAAGATKATFKKEITK